MEQRGGGRGEGYEEKGRRGGGGGIAKLTGEGRLQLKKCKPKPSATTFRGLFHTSLLDRRGDLLNCIISIEHQLTS